MKSERKLATWAGILLGLSCALALAAVQAHAADKSDGITEEFHHTYPLTADGRVALENINGPAHISSWDRNEIKVDAVKHAGDQEMLNDAHIEVHASSGYVAIRTEYRDAEHDHNFYGWRNPAWVEYTITVPRRASLEEVKLINGALDITDIAGDVQASCINGELSAKGLAGRIRLANINGHSEVQITQLSSAPVEISSVNGSLEVTLPSDAKAEIEASTVHGGIDNEFGLRVNHHQFVGQDLRGEMGGGGTHIRLSNVNGSIEIHHATDGRARSPVKDLNRSGDDSEI